MELQSSLVASDEPRGSVLIAHGFAEHHGRYASLKRALNEAGYDVWFRDFTGHGSSPGARATVDVGALIGEHLEARKELNRVTRTGKNYLFGHSMGGLITLASILLDPHHIEAVAVTGPALRPLPHVGVRAARAGQTLARIIPAIKSVTLDDTVISRDPQVVEAYRSDPLVYHGKVPLLTGSSMVVQGDQVIRNAGMLGVPTLIMHGSQDGLADVEGSAEFAEAAPEGLVTVEVVEGAFHELLNEPEHADHESTVIDWYNQH
ncbi:alpha/beta hydrolase [Actinomycetaceae bacterium MB13-C1-2]|nr:alpha/beta hydrolase [Actinomycetaceae bacterium MB13-C1-2]